MLALARGSALVVKAQHCPGGLRVSKTARCLGGALLQPTLVNIDNRTRSRAGPKGLSGCSNFNSPLKSCDRLSSSSRGSFFLVGTLLAFPFFPNESNPPKPSPKRVPMAIFGHAFKAAKSDVAATPGFHPKLGKVKMYSYLILKEIVGMVLVIPYGVHAMLTHRFLPLGEALQQDLVGGLGQLGQVTGLEATRVLNPDGVPKRKEEAINDEAIEIGSPVDLNPWSGSLQKSGLRSSSGGLELAGERGGRNGRGWFPKKSVYSASVIRDLRYGEKERERLDIFTPAITDTKSKSADRKNLPVVLFVHGGVWSSGEKWQYAPLGARLAHEGCVAAVMSYSIYPEALALEQSEQVSHALDWVFQNIHRYGGDPNKVTLAGHSSGAHISSLALYHRAKQRLAAPSNPPRQPRAFVGLAGVYDIFEHLKYEQWRGVALLSCMTPANGGVEHFSEVSAVRLFESLGEQVGKSGGAELALEGGAFLGEATDAMQVILGGCEREGRPWKEWPFSRVVDSNVVKGGRLSFRGEKDEVCSQSDAKSSTDSAGLAGGKPTGASGPGLQITNLVPLMVIQSSPADATVPIDTSVAFARSLEALGCRVKNLVYDNLGHSEFVIWPRKFEGVEALGPHIRDMLRIVKQT